MKLIKYMNNKLFNFDFKMRYILDFFFYIASLTILKLIYNLLKKTNPSIFESMIYIILSFIILIYISHLVFPTIIYYLTFFLFLNLTMFVSLGIFISWLEQIGICLFILIIIYNNILKKRVGELT